MLVANRYVVVQKLGEGGMGSVYRVKDRLSGDWLALKQVIAHPKNDLFSTRTYETDSEEMRVALAREFQTLASLRHPNIISVLDYGFAPPVDADRVLNPKKGAPVPETSSDTVVLKLEATTTTSPNHLQPYFTMPFLEDFQPLDEAAKPLTLEGKMELVIQVLQALVYLHRRGVIHRDIKPANLMVRDGQVKVVDFGLATTAQQVTGIAGTIAYLAPEVLRGAPPTIAADLYALGVLIFTLVVGRHPFYTPELSRLTGRVLTDVPDLDLLPEKLLFPIGRLLEKNPADRYQDASTVIQEVARAIGMPIPAESQTIRESFIQAARFVGRERELAQLNQALEAVMDDQGGGWLVGGESGIGKSRLLNEVRTQAMVKGALVLKGQAFTEGGAPYQLWRDVLRHLCLHVELTDIEAQVLKALVPDIEIILGRGVDDAPDVDPDVIQTRLFTVITDAIRRYGRPMMIFLEDLQWGNEGLILLKRVSALIHEIPLLIIGSYRNDEREDIPFVIPNMQLMILPRLDMKGVVELGKSILGEEVGARPDVIDLLHGETEGNIFFIVEVVRYLAERFGQMNMIGVQTLPAHIFEGGIRQVVQHRLQRVPASAQALLKFAAVAGRYLDLQLLTMLAHQYPPLLAGAASVEQWLSLCADASVLEVSGGAWRFTHDKIREGLLLEIAADDKPRLHEIIARALEAAYPNDRNQSALLAYHWEAAENIQQSTHYAIQAGEQALETANYHQTVTLLTRARTKLKRHFPETPALTFARLERFLGDAYNGLGQVEAARESFEAALTILGKPLPQGTRPQIRQMVRQLMQQFRHIARRPKPSEIDYARAELVRSQSALILIYYWKGERPTTVLLILRALNDAEHLPPTPELIRAYSSMYSLMLVLGLPLEKRYERLIRETAAAVNHPLSLAAALRNQVTMSIGRGLWDKAKHEIDQSYAVAMQNGEFRIAGDSREFLRYWHWYQGDWAAAGRAAQDLYDLSVRSENIQHQAWSCSSLGFDNLRQGDAAKAIAFFHKGIELHSGEGAKGHLLLSYGALAGAYTQAEDWPNAREAADECAAIIATAPPLSSSSLDGYVGTLSAYLALLNHDPAANTVRESFETLLQRLFKYSRAFKIGRPAYGYFAGEYAALQANTAQATKSLMRSLEDAQTLGMKLWVAHAEVALARLLPRDDLQRVTYLQTALSRFEIGGATWLAQQTARLLD